MVLMPSLAFAQVCPASTWVVNGFRAAADGSGTPGSTAAIAFIGTGTMGGCVYSKIGGATNAPTMCQTFIQAGGHGFTATWSNVTARTNAPVSAGCRFDCGSGLPKSNTCFVNAETGMPVELLEFSVESVISPP